MRIGSNSAGNTAKDIRKFLRESGERPTCARVEQIQREVSRSQTENERLVRISKELAATTGRPTTVDAKGDVKARAVAHVKAQLAKRKR